LTENHKDAMGLETLYQPYAGYGYPNKTKPVKDMFVFKPKNVTISSIIDQIKSYHF